MIRPEELLGHTRCAQYSIRTYRGKGCAGEVFGAERVAHNPCAGLRSDFGGGLSADHGGARVTLEIAPDGVAFDAEEIQRLNSLHPHAHLLRCLDVGQSQDEDLEGAFYLVTEPWRDTLAQVLAQRVGLEDHEVRNMAAAIAAALARFHAEGRTHGDVRAERICRVDRQWKLAPVCEGRLNGGVDDGSKAATPQDDLHALAVVLLRCLSPKFSLLRKKTPSRLPTQTEIDQGLSDVSEFWRRWLRRCLAMEPLRCSAAELALMNARIPSPVPEVLVDREADQFGVQYRVHWQPAGEGAVQVYRWLRGRCPAQGEIWLRADLERMAENIPLTMDNGTHVPMQPGAACQIIVVTVAGEAAVIGDSITLTWAADVDRLKLTVEGESIVATWDWPKGAPIAHVVVREGAFATGSDDPQASRDMCFHAGYVADGSRFVVPIASHVGVVHVTVYAVHRYDEGWEQASGRTSGARKAIAMIPNVRLRYRVEKVSLLKRLFLKMQPWRLVMRADRAAMLPELTLVAGQSGGGSGADVGVPVLHVPSQQYASGMVIQKDFQPPEGVKIENTRLLVHGKCKDRVRLIPERGRLSRLSG